MNARKRLTFSLVMLFLVFLTGTAGYGLLGYSPIDSVYMTVLTITTLGSRDVETLWAQLWSTLVVTVGLFAAAYAFSTFIALMTSGELLKVFGRQKLENKINITNNM